MGHGVQVPQPRYNVARRHAACFLPKNGRRLRDAAKEAQDVATDMFNLAKHLPEEWCGGGPVVREQVRNMLLKGASVIPNRFKYLRLVPWAYSNADTKEGALEVIAQMTGRPLEQHDILSRDLWRRLENDIRNVGAGQEPSVALAKEVALLNLVSLDECAGEGDLITSMPVSISMSICIRYRCPPPFGILTIQRLKPLT